MFLSMNIIVFTANKFSITVFLHFFLETDDDTSAEQPVSSEVRPGIETGSLTNPSTNDTATSTGLVWPTLVLVDLSLFHL